MDEKELIEPDIHINMKQCSSDSTESADSAKRLKTEDSGVFEDTGTSSDDIKNIIEDSSNASTSFSRPSNSKTRNYRKPDLDSDDSDTEETGETSQCPEPQESTSTGTVKENPEEKPVPKKKRLWTPVDVSSSSGEDNDSSSPLALNDSEDSDIDMSDPPVLSKSKPKHKWFMVPEIVNRQLGMGGKYHSGQLFQRKCYGSLHCVQRLELMYKLGKHDGCVNTLNFHPNGQLLASGSDDLSIVIWDWPTGKDLLSFDSKHRGNVFQSKFLSLSGDLHIVSCARDGQVRLHQISRTEGSRSSRRLGMHKGPVHKIALMNDQPHIVISVGEDACVISHDVRINKPTKLLVVQNAERKIPLYSVHSHPISTNEFCVGGRDQFVRVYDQRKANTLMKSFIPQHVDKKTNDLGLHVTCAIYNHNGTEILASYNDEDIYLFDTTSPDATHVHCYQGHRNAATIKGVNFFGPKSEFIVSGSDCGHVYFWDKNTESIVQWMLADDNGAVNVLEPHPQLPIICTSGLDWDVKVWVPSCEYEPKMEGLEETVRRNNRIRITEKMRSSSNLNESQVLWMLWRHLRTRERIQRAVNDMTGTAETSHSADAELTLSEDSSDSDDMNSSDSGDAEDIHPLSCSPS